jgi:hypothetical protein
MTYTAEQLRAMVAEAQEGDWKIYGKRVVNPDGDAELGNWSVAEFWWPTDGALLVQSKIIATALADALDEIARLRDALSRIEGKDSRIGASIRSDGSERKVVYGELASIARAALVKP